MELGTQTYIVNKLTQCYAKGDLKEHLNIFRNALGFYLVVGAVGLAIVSAGVFFDFFNKFLNIEITDGSIINGAVLILGINVLLGIVGGLVLGLYASFGEYYRQVALIAAREASLVILVAAGLILGANFILMALLYLMVSLCVFFFAFKDIRKRYPEIIFRAYPIDWKLIKGFVSQGLFFLMIPLANTIAIQGSILFIGVYFSAGAVAVFSAHKTLSNFAVRIGDAIKGSIDPELAAMEIREDYQRLRLIYNFILKFVMLFSFSIAVFLFFIGGDIINIWTSGKIVLDKALWTILMVNLPINLFLLFNSAFHIATNKYKAYSISKLISAVLGFIFAVILVFYFNLGIAGIVLAFTVSEAIIVGLVISQKTSQIIKADVKLYWLKNIAMILPIGVLHFTFGWVIYKIIDNLIIKIVFLGTAIFALGAIFYKFLFNQEEKNIIKSLLKRIFLKSPLTNIYGEQ
jgi:O-antigen/teichoic acid export membrane protein